MKFIQNKRSQKLIKKYKFFVKMTQNVTQALANKGLFTYELAYIYIVTSVWKNTENIEN